MEQGQRIEEWEVLCTNRLSGAVHNRPGHRDGGMIVTSPVVEVRLMGRGGGGWANAHAIAFTESGSAYRLGTPSKALGFEQAEHFVHAHLVAETRPLELGTKSTEPDTTIVRAAVCTSLHSYDCIDVYETSFKPL